MAQFIKCQKPDGLQKIFLVHGELEAQEFYRDYLKTMGYRDIEIPKAFEEVVL